MKCIQILWLPLGYGAFHRRLHSIEKLHLQTSWSQTGTFRSTSPNSKALSNRLTLGKDIPLRSCPCVESYEPSGQTLPLGNKPCFSRMIGPDFNHAPQATDKTFKLVLGTISIRNMANKSACFLQDHLLRHAWRGCSIRKSSQCAQVLVRKGAILSDVLFAYPLVVNNVPRQEKTV